MMCMPSLLKWKEGMSTVDVIINQCTALADLLMYGLDFGQRLLCKEKK